MQTSARTTSVTPSGIVRRQYRESSRTVSQSPAHPGVSRWLYWVRFTEQSSCPKPRALPKNGGPAERHQSNADTVLPVLGQLFRYLLFQAAEPATWVPPAWSVPPDSRRFRDLTAPLPQVQHGGPLACYLPASYSSFAPPLWVFMRYRTTSTWLTTPVAEVVNPDTHRGSFVRDSHRR